MLNGERLQLICRKRKMSVPTLAEYLVRGGFDAEQVQTALRNWMRRLYIPKPTAEDVRRLANALGIEVGEISLWQASHRYAPSTARKARLVMDLFRTPWMSSSLSIAGRPIIFARFSKARLPTPTNRKRMSSRW